MDLWIIALPIVPLLAVVFLVIYYKNRIAVLSNRIDNALSQIDVQLKRRVDLVPNLVNTVKGIMKHEKSVIDSITKARENMMRAGDMKERVKSDAALSRALKTIFALAENYPNLKADENFRLLQEQLEGVENKIAYSRQFYNDSVLEFNNLITTIPGKWLAGGKSTREYFETTGEERKPVKVEF